MYNWANRSFFDCEFAQNYPSIPLHHKVELRSLASDKIMVNNDIYITDPPYADAVNYHEITEYFIAWLRKNPPKPFDEWTWGFTPSLSHQGVWR